MAVSFIPLVGPLISCIIDGTFVDMINALRTGDWATLGMCALAFVPGGKIVGKVGKFVGHADDIGKITKRLEKHLASATKNAKLTGPQLNALKSKPGLEKAFRGRQVHAAFKESVEGDKWLAKRVAVHIDERDALGRYVSAPDVSLGSGGHWWDVTTNAQWDAHVDKYTSMWGQGHALYY